MAVAEKCLSKANCRMSQMERLQSHSMPRVNLHRDALDSDWDDFLAEPSSIECYSNFKSSLPVPLFPVGLVTRASINGVDPSQKVVAEKRAHRMKLQRAAGSSRIDPSHIAEATSLLDCDDSEGYLDPKIYSLARMVREDPDPYVADSYNSYYSNSAALTEFKGRTLVIYHDPSSPGKLNLLFPKITEDICLTDEIQYVEHSMGEGEIYSVDYSSNMLLLRQKSKCALFKLKGDKACRLKELMSVSAKKVYLSSCLNEFSRNEFSVLSPDFLLETHDLQEGSRLERKIDVEEPIEDVWGHIHRHDQNTLMLVNRRTVRLLDLRQPGCALKWNVEPVTEMCDDVHAAAKGSSLHYVATKHYLMSLDLRVGWHQRWAHCLVSSPSLLTVVQRQKVSDTLLVGSQQNGSVVCVNNVNTTEFDLEFAKSPPLKLSSPIETLHVARIAGHCLSPMVSSRFSMSLVGLTAYKSFEEVHVFTLSSLGDVFNQTLTPKDDSEPLDFTLLDEELTHLDAWADACELKYNRERLPILATQMTPCLQYADFFDEPETPTVPESPRRSNSRQRWQVSKKHLFRCKDVLAPTLLAHWAVEDDDEWASTSDSSSNKTSPESSSDEEDDFHVKVNKWLEKHSHVSEHEHTPVKHSKLS